MSSLNIIYVIILIIIITIIYVLFNSYYNCKNATMENLQLIDSSPILNCDILIVGAGASGIYCAWRLSQEYPNKRIIVAESTDRIGGRLESIPFGNADIYAEMGGMRTFPGIDTYLTQLLQILNIPTIVLPYIEPDNIAFVRGHRMNINVLNSSSSTSPERKKLIMLYQLPEREYNISINDLILDTVKKVAPYYQTDWSQIYQSDYLNNTSFVKMLQENGVSNGAIEAYRDFSGYNFSFDVEIAASTGIRENISLSGMGQQHFVIGGYDLFIKKMALETFSRPNTSLMLSTRLKKLMPENNNTADCLFQTNNNSVMINSKSVILAIARDSLLQVDAPWTNSAIQAMGSVNSWSAFKAFLSVDKQTYQILSRNGLLKGRCISDLPARQIWFYSENPPELLVYADDIDADYWSKYVPEEGKQFPIHSNPNQNIPLVSELIRQIAIVFGVNQSMIKINDIIYKYWNAGAYFWRPSNIPYLMSSIDTPIDSQYAVYTSGSDFSYSQGWVEGAIESADGILTKYFGLNNFVDKYN
ncbi:amine oxidase [Bandra megavirus]|uniref:Amine oxidase n=1 Tax=Bandra megavirus TaxID=2071566 RepID=A0A2K9V9G0_9VIRU|nr:amine oxidase [Bandra megavirus]